MARYIFLCTCIFSCAILQTWSAPTWAQTDLEALPRLDSAQTLAENALWLETPLDRQFKNRKQVTVAEVSGPGIITMLHFALPGQMIAQPDQYRLGREVLLRMYWDGEPSPSVDCPMVDFFCDPAGERDRVDTALVNKKRGWNAYFPMPFRKSARIELVYDGPVQPGQELWSRMPCYSYVMVQRLPSLPEDIGSFHAQWRQKLVNLGKTDYLALEASGRGKFIGWNVTVRLPGRSGYPVDENERFYIDAQEKPAVEFQGIEDAFGFSWGFPSEENMFPLTGYFPFHKEGAAAYRFFFQDAIRFQKSLKLTIGFGEKEDPGFRTQFGKPGNELEFSTTVYWYQTEPHAPFPPMPPAEHRRPRERQDMENLPSQESLEKKGVKLHFRCGRPEQELIYAAPGYGAKVLQGFPYTGWPFPVYHTRADEKEVRIEIAVPPGRSGLLRLYMIDPDHFMGGRDQEVFLGEQSAGQIKNFDEGKWLEIPVGPPATNTGSLLLRIVNRNPRSNAVMSIIEWTEPTAL